MVRGWLLSPQHQHQRTDKGALKEDLNAIHRRNHWLNRCPKKPSMPRLSGLITHESGDIGLLFNGCYLEVCSSYRYGVDEPLQMIFKKCRRKRSKMPMNPSPYPIIPKSISNLLNAPSKGPNRDMGSSFASWSRRWPSYKKSHVRRPI